jgi:hypothetical protein
VTGFAVESRGQGYRALMSWRGLLLLGIVGLSLSQFASWRKLAGSQDGSAQLSCPIWDREASEGIATLIFDGSAAAELRLDEAILQLRRARKNCRAGSTEVAGHDYKSLHQTFRTSTGSIRTPGNK